MIEPFSWAQNAFKLERARISCGADATEDKIKEAYIALGGLVVPGYEIPEVVEEKPKKTAKRK